MTRILICGSREATPDMLTYARNCVARALEQEWMVVCGDAPGVDGAVAAAVRDLYKNDDEMMLGAWCFGIQPEPRHGIVSPRIAYHNILGKRVVERTSYESGSASRRYVRMYENLLYKVTSYKERDRYMVEQSDMVLCITTMKGTPGTLNVYRMAYREGMTCWLKRF